MAGACVVAVAAGAAPTGPVEATLGPGPGHAVVGKAGYRLELSITPNLGGRIDSDFRLRLTQAGRPVAAAILLRFTMPAMEMPELRLALRPAGPGVYAGTGQKLTMPGRWHIRVHVVPHGKPPLEVLLADLATLQ